MEQELLDRIPGFAGGDVEIHDKDRGFTYHGRIRTIKVDQQGILRMTFVWCAHAVDASGRLQLYPEGGWVKIDVEEYSVPLVDLSSGRPVLLLNSTKLDLGRISLSKTFAFQIYLVPPTANLLDPSEVQGM